MAEETEERRGANSQDSMGRPGTAFTFTSPFVLLTVRELSPTEKVARRWSDSRSWALAPGPLLSSTKHIREGSPVHQRWQGCPQHSFRSNKWLLV